MVASIDFFPGGDTAYIAVSHQPVGDEGSIFVCDVNQDEVTGRVYK